MSRKKPAEERALILAKDQRRKYGARLTFQVQRSAYIGELENVTLLVDDGTLAKISPGRTSEWEGGKRYEVELVGYSSASAAESAGTRLAQALLLGAISLNFGLRLNYSSHEVPTVFDRTLSNGLSLWAEGFSSYPQNIVLDELTKTLAIPAKDQRLLLSMELFAASALESNDRTRFVMAVSALEPLANQVELGLEVAKLVDKFSEVLASSSEISETARDSLRGRVRQLKQESIRQALRRLCEKWFPAEESVWKNVDDAYALRSEILHLGRPTDRDVLLSKEIQKVSAILRKIYQIEFGHTLRFPVGF